MRTLSIVFLVLLMVGMLPLWPYSSGWSVGYFPSGGLLVLVVALFLLSADGRGRAL